MNMLRIFYKKIGKIQGIYIEDFENIKQNF
jgi:hypothetical protein